MLLEVIGQIPVAAVIVALLVTMSAGSHRVAKPEGE
jgi:hypothetical protein